MHNPNQAGRAYAGQSASLTVPVNGIAKDTPVLVIYNQRLADSIATLDKALGRLTNAADRMLGSVPETPSSSLGGEVMPGTLGELDNGLRLLAERLSDLHAVVNRLETI